MAYPPEQAGPVPGRVIGRWSDDKVLIRLEDGRVVEAPVPDEVQDFDVGDPVEVRVDPDGNPVSWKPVAG